MADFTKTIYGGGGALLTEADLPLSDLPRHPFTGEILPRKDAMGVPQELKVRVIEDEDRYQAVPFYDEFTGGYRLG